MTQVTASKSKKAKPALKKKTHKWDKYVDTIIHYAKYAHTTVNLQSFATILRLRATYYRRAASGAISHSKGKDRRAIFGRCEKKKFRHTLGR